jgi:hypothetical protein
VPTGLELERDPPSTAADIEDASTKATECLPVDRRPFPDRIQVTMRFLDPDETVISLDDVVGGRIAMPAIEQRLPEGVVLRRDLLAQPMASRSARSTSTFDSARR